MSRTLHLSAGSELHLGLPDDADADEVLALCTEALRNGRVIELPGLLPPGGVDRSTVVVNFAQVVGLWLSEER
jgi:hypothetical protein